MVSIINLVATRQKAGEPAELLSWYNDHVTLLMGFEDLLGATLYHCSPPAAAAPNYVCMYDFPSLSAFAAFEASAAKERARQVTESGWGKQGIEIIQRNPYAAGGKWTGPTTLPASSFHIHCLDMQVHDVDSVKRWIANSLYAAAGQAGVSHYEWFASGDQQQVITLAAASTAFAPAWHSWWNAAAGEPQGQAPGSVRVQWQARCDRVSAWRR